MKAALDNCVCAYSVGSLEALVILQGTWLVDRWRGANVTLEALPLELGLLGYG